MAVLRQILVDSSQFEETFLKPLNILYLKYRIADLLWEQDQKLARRLFVEAFKEAGDKRLDDPVSDMSLRLRQEIFELLLPHDASLAEGLANSITRQDDVPPMQALRQQATLMAQIATGIEHSPQQAAMLIQQSFNGFFGPQQIEALQSLRERQPERADEIFLYALSLVERKPSNLSNKIRILSPYLFPEPEPEGTRQGQNKPVESKRAKSSPAMVTRYLEFVYGVFMPQPIEAQMAENNEFRRASFDARGMKELIPYFEKYKPELASEYRNRIEEIWANIKQSDRLDTLEREAELYQQFFSQPATDLIAKAEQTEDQSKRTELYGQAAYILTIQRKFEEAIELLKRIPANNGEAVIGDAHLYSLAAEDSIEKGEIEQAAKYLRKIKDPASLTGGLIKIARIYITQDKAPQAKRLLEEAKQNLKLVTDQTTGVRLMVAIANTEAKLDSSRGFRDMEAAVETLNRIGWGEGNGHAMGPDGITLRMNTYDFSEGLVLLARADFSRSLSLAKKMRQKEASAFALIAVCRGALRRE